MDYVQVLVKKISKVLDSMWDINLPLRDLAEEYQWEKKLEREKGIPRCDPKVGVEACPECGGVLFYITYCFTDQGLDHTFICARCGYVIGGILDDSIKAEDVLERD